MSELLNCPFCGGEMFVESNRDTHKLKGRHSSSCVLDDFDYWVPAMDNCLEYLIKDWNTRTPPEGFVLVPAEPTGEMINR